MSERGYSISLKLDGTRLCVSLLDDEAWGAEKSGDSVDLAPLLTAAFRAGQQDMQRRAVEVAKRHDTGDMLREDMEARRIANAIAALEIKDEQ